MRRFASGAALAAIFLATPTPSWAGVLRWDRTQELALAWNTHEIAFGRGQDVYLAYAGLAFSRSLDGGGSWSAGLPLGVGLSGWSGNPDIEVDSQGRIYVVYESEAPGRFQPYLQTSDDRGATWSPPRRIATSPKNALWPRIEIDSLDRVHVVWHDTFYSHHDGSFDDPRVEFYHLRSDDRGATWTPRRRVAAGEGAWTLATALDGDDNLYAFWSFARRDGVEGTFCYRSADGGDSWTSSLIAEGNSVAAVVDPLGVVRVVWVEGAGGHKMALRYRESRDGAESWSRPRDLAVVESMTNWNPTAWPAIAASRSRVFVAVQGQDLGEENILIFESRNDGRRWRRPKNISRTLRQSVQPSLFYRRKTLHALWNEVSPGFDPVHLVYRRAVIERR